MSDNVHDTGVEHRASAAQSDLTQSTGLLTPDEPVNLVATLSLTAGEYVIQPFGGNGSIFLSKQETATRLSPGLCIGPGERERVKIGSVPVWVWTGLEGVSVIVSPV